MRERSSSLAAAAERGILARLAPAAKETSMPSPRLALALLAALTAAAPARSATFVYVHDRRDPNQVHAFSLAKNGDLAPVAGTPFASADPVPNGEDQCGGLCQTMAGDKKSHRLFTSGATGVSAWDVAEDGTLALVPGSPFGGTTPLFGVAAVRVGSRVFVYAAEYDFDRLRGFEAQPDGSLVELPSSPFPAGDGPNGVASAKRLVFATSEDGAVASYAVGDDGALAAAPGSPLALDPPPNFVYNATPDAQGKLLFVADDGFDDPVNDANDLPTAVYAFAVDKKTGTLTPVAGSPFDTSMPLEAVVGVTGASTAKKLVVAVGFQEVNDDLQVFKIGKGGALTQLGAAQDSGLNALAHALDPKGKWLLVASDANLRVSAISGKTGVVTSVDQQPLGAGGAESNAIVLLSR
jgi:6-phosphogluconolactonase (cycloisomerase 2 family)